MKRMTFLTFVERVLRLRLTAPWRVVIALAFDNAPVSKLTPAEQQIAHAIFGPNVDDVPPSARRVVVLYFGRESWKSTISAAWQVFSIFNADLTNIGPGDEPVAPSVSVDKKTARVTIKMGRALVHGAPTLKRFFLKDTSDGFLIRRPDGHVVAFESFAASRGGASTRGRTVVGFVVDEAAFMLSDGAYAITDRDAFNAMIPRLLPGGKAVLVSTPWSVPTLMSELFEANYNSPTTAIAGLAGTTTMRPDDADLATRIEVERRRDAVHAAREFDCDRDAFASEGMYLDANLIAEAVDLNRPAVLYAPRDAITGAAADIGLVKDSSAAVVGAVVGREFCALELLEMRPTARTPLKLSAVIGEFAKLLQRHGLTTFSADHHALQPAREWASSHGITIRAAPGGQDAKAESYIALQQAFKERRVRIPNHARLIAQLRSVVVRPLPGGGMRFDVPRRTDLAHGDLVSALVLAFNACTSGHAKWTSALRNFDLAAHASRLGLTMRDMYPDAARYARLGRY